MKLSSLVHKLLSGIHSTSTPMTFFLFSFDKFSELDHALSLGSILHFASAVFSNVNDGGATVTLLRKNF